MPASQDPNAVSRAGRPSDPQILIENPTIGDGPDLWRLARDGGGLDLNSPYTYLLWCRDFSGTSVVARAGENAVGFVTGYRRPDADDTLFVWQVAVNPKYRGQRIGVRMLEGIGDLIDKLGCRYMEATVTPDNTASLRMFASFARARGAELVKSEGFDSTLFPDNHQPEDLIRIGPL